MCMKMNLCFFQSNSPSYSDPYHDPNFFLFSFRWRPTIHNSDTSVFFGDVLESSDSSRTALANNFSPRISFLVSIHTTGSFVLPESFELVWHDPVCMCYVWRPIPPSSNYMALGMLATRTRKPPTLSSFRCVHKNLLRQQQLDDSVFVLGQLPRSFAVWRVPTLDSFFLTPIALLDTQSGISLETSGTIASSDSLFTTFVFKIAISQVLNVESSSSGEGQTFPFPGRNRKLRLSATTSREGRYPKVIPWSERKSQLRQMIRSSTTDMSSRDILCTFDLHGKALRTTDKLVDLLSELLKTAQAYEKSASAEQPAGTERSRWVPALNYEHILPLFKSLAILQNYIDTQSRTSLLSGLFTIQTLQGLLSQRILRAEFVTKRLLHFDLRGIVSASFPLRAMLQFVLNIWELFDFLPTAEWEEVVSWKFAPDLSDLNLIEVRDRIAADVPEGFDNDMRVISFKLLDRFVSDRFSGVANILTGFMALTTGNHVVKVTDVEENMAPSLLLPLMKVNQDLKEVLDMCHEHLDLVHWWVSNHHRRILQLFLQLPLQLFTSSDLLKCLEWLLGWRVHLNRIAHKWNIGFPPDRAPLELSTLADSLIYEYCERLHSKYRRKPAAAPTEGAPPTAMITEGSKTVSAGEESDIKEAPNHSPSESQEKEKDIDLDAFFEGGFRLLDPHIRSLIVADIWQLLKCFSRGIGAPTLSSPSPEPPYHTPLQAAVIGNHTLLVQLFCLTALSSRQLHRSSVLGLDEHSSTLHLRFRAIP